MSDPDRDLAATLRAYLEAAGRRPFGWGTFDCFVFVADWLIAAGHPDPATAFRGTYGTRQGARGITQDHGGTVRCADALLTAIGCTPTARPNVGDVGLVRIAVPLAVDDVGRVRLGKQTVGAICAPGRRWAIKTTAATLTLAPAAFVRAWSLPRL